MTCCLLPWMARWLLNGMMQPFHQSSEDLHAFSTKLEKIAKPEKTPSY